MNNRDIRYAYSPLVKALVGRNNSDAERLGSELRSGKKSLRFKSTECERVRVPGTQAGNPLVLHEGKGYELAIEFGVNVGGKFTPYFSIDVASGREELSRSQVESLARELQTFYRLGYIPEVFSEKP